MRRILSVIAVMALMAVMLMAMAAPAFAVPGKAFDNSNSDCNAGKGNGPDRVPLGQGAFVECDPASSGNNRAGLNA